MTEQQAMPVGWRQYDNAVYVLENSGHQTCNREQLDIHRNGCSNVLTNVLVFALMLVGTDHSMANDNL